MQTIGSFLNRYENFVPPVIVVARSVCSVIKQTIGVELKENQVRIMHGNVYITAHGIIKSEIILNKKSILLSLQSLNGASICDIR